MFSERQVDVLGEWAGDADCTVIAYASVLPKLHDRQQLTALIRSGELEVQGDIQVVQNFVALADLASSTLRNCWPLIPVISPLKESAKPCAEAQSSCIGIKRQQRYVAEAITEEWRMAPGPLEVAWFAEETAAVQACC